MRIYNKDKAREYYKKNCKKIREYNRKRSKEERLTNPYSYYNNLVKRVRKWRKLNPLKVKAQRKVFVELRAGRIKRKPCEVCSDIKSEAHHPDYSKPLKIIWLCKIHHRERDRIDNK